MPASNLSFAKVVATPTLKSWSQAYNAGGLFIVLSLSSNDEELQKELPTHGKQVLSNLEAEFFGLEEKNFGTIKKAISSSIPDLPEDLIISLSLAYSKDDTLFGFVLGNGRISLKRQDKIGIILESLTATDRRLHSSSGYLESNDIILIQTAPFAETVPAKIIIEALDNTLPNDIAETISPSVHRGSEGGASAIILSYKGISRAPEIEDDILAAEPKNEEAKPETVEKGAEAPHIPIHRAQIADSEEPRIAIDEDQQSGPTLIDKLKTIVPSSLLSQIQLNRQKKIMLAVTCIILGLLIVSIIFVRKNSQSSKNHELFTQIYTSAKKDYDEGEGLLSLNKSLAHDDYASAKKTLESASGKFKTGSSDETKLNELSDLVNKRLAELGGSSQATAKEADSSSAPSLAALAKDSSILASTMDDTTVYTITNKSITKDDQTGIKNDSTWSQVVAIGAFSGNLYVLDTKNGLIKFVPAGNSYAQSIYFKGDAPDLKSATSMAIDSSIYILFSDGSVQKYTRGTKDSFSLSGLTTALNKPTSIYTSPDVQNIYVLDTNNSRIVKLDKSGTFVSELKADVLKSAKGFIVSKDEKSAFVLTNSKIYQINF